MNSQPRQAEIQPIEVLMMAELAKFPYESLDEGYRIHRWWEIEDKGAFLAQHGARIRGLVAAGTRRIDAPLLQDLPALEVIANIGVGYDRLDIDAVKDRGIIATNTPDVLTGEVADLTVALLLATVRRIPQAERFLRARKWASGTFPYSPSSLQNRKVGILGLGRIGKAVARRLDGFDVEIAYHGRFEQPGLPYAYYATVLELARAVDVLVSIVPSTPDTTRLIDGAVLEALGPEGILINVARGAVVDQQALTAALQSGRLLAAGLDVYWAEPSVPAELLALDNVVLLPHIGSGTVPTRRAMIELVFANIRSWFQGEGPLTPVPETPWRTCSDAAAAVLQNAAG